MPYVEGETLRGRIDREKQLASADVRLAVAPIGFAHHGQLVHRPAKYFIFAFFVLRAPLEEQKLAERFGDEYRAYIQRTGRFVPRRASRR